MSSLQFSVLLANNCNTRKAEVALVSVKPLRFRPICRSGALRRQIPGTSQLELSAPLLRRDSAYAEWSLCLVRSSMLWMRWQVMLLIRV